MGFDLLYKETDGYLLVSVAGKWMPDAAEDAVARINDEAQDRGYDKVLVDAREVGAPQSEFYRFLAGEDIAKTGGSRLRVAILFRPQLIIKFLENTAVNRGARVFVLSDFDEAVNWLVERS